MNFLSRICALVLLFSTSASPAAEHILLEESFDRELSADWFWGLGTWTAKDGVLRGFESGARRHGPVNMRKVTFEDATLTCEFRLERGATFAGIIFNGSPERGHLVHLVMGADKVRILAHPKKGESLELLKEPASLAVGTWHRVKIAFIGATFTATVDGKIYSVSNKSIAEEKLSFGLGGDSGGQEGEKAGALEFRALQLTAPDGA